MVWKEHGVKIVRGTNLDSNTPQTPGMNRAAAITNARTGASKLWAGTVVVQPNAKTGPHHHGELETVLYISFAAGLACDGVISWNSAGRQAQAISSMFLPTCPTRRSTVVRTNRVRLSWYGAVKIRSWSTSTSRALKP